MVSIFRQTFLCMCYIFSFYRIMHRAWAQYCTILTYTSTSLSRFSDNVASQDQIPTYNSVKDITYKAAQRGNLVKFGFQRRNGPGPGNRNSMIFVEHLRNIQWLTC